MPLTYKSTVRIIENGRFNTYKDFEKVARKATRYTDDLVIILNDSNPFAAYKDEKEIKQIEIKDINKLIKLVKPFIELMEQERNMLKRETSDCITSPYNREILEMFDIEDPEESFRMRF